MTYSNLWQRLLPHYDEREAKAVVRTLVEELFQLTLTDLYAGGLDKLTTAEQQRLETSLQQLEAGIPVQYVTGTARFFGRDYHDLKQKCSAKQFFRHITNLIVRCNRLCPCVC